VVLWIVYWFLNPDKVSGVFAMSMVVYVIVGLKVLGIADDMDYNLSDRLNNSPMYADIPGNRHYSPFSND